MCGTCMARKCTYAGSPTAGPWRVSRRARARASTVARTASADERDEPQRAHEQHEDLPAPVLGDPEGERVVHAVQGDARIQRSGALAQQAEREAEEGQRQQEGGLGRADVDRPEDQAGDDRRRPRALPVAQRAEEEAAEEELLGHRRHDRDQEGHGQQREGAVLDAELVGQLRVVGADAQDRHPHERERRRRRRRRRAIQPTAGQKRVGRRPNCSGAAGPAMLAKSSAAPMNDRSWTMVAEMLTAGAGVGEARARGGADDPDDERPHEGAAEGGDERRPRHPRLPARALGRRRALDALGQLGRDVERGRRDRGGRGGHACSDAEYEAAGMSYVISSPSRDATTRTPAGAWRAVAGDEHRLQARRARAGDVVPRRCRRRGSPRRPLAPRRSSAARKIAGSGLATPSSAEMTTASTSARRPVRSRTSCSETSQLRDHGQPRAARAQALEHGGHLGVGAEADRRQQGVLDVGQRQRRAQATPARRRRSAGAGPSARPSRAPRRGGRGSRPSRPASPRARPRGRPPRRARPARAPGAATASRARPACRGHRAGPPRGYLHAP